MVKNPYASFLDSASDAVEVIQSTPDQIDRFLKILDPEKLNLDPAPGKWSVRNILSHLADCEIVFAFRLRQALAEDRHMIQPFDQDKFAVRYGCYNARTAADVFNVTRKWNIALINGLSEADFARPLNHPERGDMTLRTIVETMAGHDRNHLKQIQAFVA
jgi:hypothetical protein